MKGLFAVYLLLLLATNQTCLGSNPIEELSEIKRNLGPRYLVLDPNSLMECGCYGTNKWIKQKCGRNLIYLPPAGKPSDFEFYGRK